MMNGIKDTMPRDLIRTCGTSRNDAYWDKIEREEREAGERRQDRWFSKLMNENLDTTEEAK